jgi:hypothetical protein
MKHKAVDILKDNRLMAISTLRGDGWPQTTMVSYANEDILIYFIVSKASQKFANIERDDRVSLVIGRDFHDPSTIKAVSRRQFFRAHPAKRPNSTSAGRVPTSGPMSCSPSGGKGKARHRNTCPS